MTPALAAPSSPGRSRPSTGLPARTTRRGCPTSTRHTCPPAWRNASAASARQATPPAARAAPWTWIAATSGAGPSTSPSSHRLRRPGRASASVRCRTAGTDLTVRLTSQRPLLRDLVRALRPQADVPGGPRLHSGGTRAAARRSRACCTPVRGVVHQSLAVDHPLVRVSHVRDTSGLQRRQAKAASWPVTPCGARVPLVYPACERCRQRRISAAKLGAVAQLVPGHCSPVDGANGARFPLPYAGPWVTHGVPPRAD
jgi:hypothetical protein